MVWGRPRIAKIIRSTTDGLVLNAVFWSRVLKCAKDSRPFGADFSMRRVTSEETLSSQLTRPIHTPNSHLANPPHPEGGTQR